MYNITCIIYIYIHSYDMCIYTKKWPSTKGEHIMINSNLSFFLMNLR